MMDFLDKIKMGKKKARKKRSLIESIKSAKGLALISEIKKKSPSQGLLRSLDPVTAAREMEEAGANAISVLTDEKYFGGSLEDLRSVSQTVKIPVLRKDFITDKHQLYETVTYGADAVLLIVGLLEENTKDFVDEAHRIGLECLVEIHDIKELDNAIDSGAKLIGINNRDLVSLKIDLKTFEYISPLIPNDRIKVAESGIHNGEDAFRMAEAGASAILVGTSIMKTPDLSEKIRELKDVG